ATVFSDAPFASCSASPIEPTSELAPDRGSGEHPEPSIATVPSVTTTKARDRRVSMSDAIATRAPPHTCADGCSTHGDRWRGDARPERRRARPSPEFGDPLRISGESPPRRPSPGADGAVDGPVVAVGFGRLAGEEDRVV